MQAEVEQEINLHVVNAPLRLIFRHHRTLHKCPAAAPHLPPPPHAP
jgi:hypothetical protein